MDHNFDKNQKLGKHLNVFKKNDDLICILIVCMLSSNTAKIVFDEFYEKKKFLDEAIKRRLDKYNKDNISEDGKVKILWIILQIKNTGKNIKYEEVNKIKFTDDKEIILLPYFMGVKIKKRNMKIELKIAWVLINCWYIRFILKLIWMNPFWNKTENIKKKCS